jgi:hypothetical protein
VVAPSWHLPSPSQVYAPTIASESHMPALHMVPSSYLRQSPLPLHVPSRPHVPLSSATHWLAVLGITPAGVGVQVPSEVAKPQD